MFTLSKQLLSRQQHYDWGLRALKAVLNTGGKLIQVRDPKPRNIEHPQYEPTSTSTSLDYDRGLIHLVLNGVIRLFIEKMVLFCFFKLGRRGYDSYPFFL